MKNKNVKFNKFRAFTLTEIMITMLIVMVVIIASLSVVAKKTTNTKNAYGYWECYINQNGLPESTLSINGTNEVIKTYDAAHPYCIFDPPSDAANFAITAIGGGGGGASASVSSQDAISLGNTVLYAPLISGKYSLIVIGGGTGSPAWTQTNYPSGDGALNNYIGCPGQAIVKDNNIQLDKSMNYVLKAGAGGEGGTYDYDSDPKETQPNNGNESKFFQMYGDKYGVNTTAKGGIWDKNYYKRQQLNSYFCSGYTNINTVNQGNYMYKTANEMMGYTSYNAKYGLGGEGTSTDTGKSGYNGIVMIISNFFFSGGGGNAGNISFRVVEKLSDHLKVTIGPGGDGGVNENSSGNSGETTIIDKVKIDNAGNIVPNASSRLMTAQGGDGGRIRLGGSSSNMYLTLTGAPGFASPLGDKLNPGCNVNKPLNGCNDMDLNKGISNVLNKNLFGAGGAGGSAKSKNNQNNNCTVANKYQPCWGKGGKGTPGYVRIEWN